MPVAENGVFHMALDRLSAIGDRVTEGALEYASMARCPWMVEIVGENVVDESNYGGCLGICGIFGNDGIIARLRNVPFPVINISNRRGIIEGLVNFISDDIKVGTIAAEHLLRHGYRHFSVVCDAAKTYAQERIQGFRSRLEKEPGVSCTVLYHDFQKEVSLRSMSSFIRCSEGILTPLFKDAPMDMAVFATNDWLAGLVQRVIQQHCPERQSTTAVLGVDDELHKWWYLGPLPSLSSVRPAFHRMGRDAMAYLMACPGDRATAMLEPIRRFAPEGVIQRASTAGGACPDPLTAQVIRWAWQAVHDGCKVTVAQLAGHFSISRRTLERRFSVYMGCSAGDYLMRQRLEVAAHLLRSTDLTIAAISHRCGYAQQDTLSACFRKMYGQTPKDFRRSHRL